VPYGRVKVGKAPARLLNLSPSSAGAARHGAAKSTAPQMREEKSMVGNYSSAMGEEEEEEEGFRPRSSEGLAQVNGKPSGMPSTYRNQRSHGYAMGELIESI